MCRRPSRASWSGSLQLGGHIATAKEHGPQGNRVIAARQHTESYWAPGFWGGAQCAFTIDVDEYADDDVLGSLIRRVWGLE